MRRFGLAERWVDRADHAEPIGGINTTPLIDVMLVLLVMFIITIPVQVNEIPLQLPQPGPALPQAHVPHLLSISRGGAVALDGERVNAAILLTRLAALAADPRNELRIRTDPEARYDAFAQTLAVVKHAGITRLGFVGNAAML